MSDVTPRCPDPDRLQEFLEDWLEEPERAAVAAHLAACGGCRDRLEAYRAIHSGLLRLREPVAPTAALASAAIARAAAERTPRWVRAATVVALAAAVLLAAWLVLPLAGAPPLPPVLLAIAPPRAIGAGELPRAAAEVLAVVEAATDPVAEIVPVNGLSPSAVVAAALAINGLALLLFGRRRR